MGVEITVQKRAEVKQIKQRQANYFVRKDQESFQKELLKRISHLENRIKELEGDK